MTLAKELNSRNLVYAKSTMDIIDKYRDTLNMVFDTMFESKMTMEWNAIDFHRGNNLLLNIVGTASYAVGQQVVNESGTTIFVDETNKGNYSQLMRLILPTQSVYRGDTSALIQFLKDYSDLVDDMTQDEIELGLEDVQFLRDNFTLFADALKDVQFIDVTRGYHEGFDLTDLNLDASQLLQLKLTTPEGQA